MFLQTALEKGIIELRESAKKQETWYKKVGYVSRDADLIMLEIVEKEAAANKLQELLDVL